MVKKKIRTPIVWFCLLTYLSAWIGASYGLPVLLMIADHTHDHAHKVFLTDSHGRIHLVLNHPENRDEPYLKSVDCSELDHDLLYNIPTISAPRQDLHPDHEIHLSDSKQEIIAATKTTGVSKISTSLVAFLTPLVFTESASVSPFAYNSPEANTTLICLRATVLLI